MLLLEFVQPYLFVALGFFAGIYGHIIVDRNRRKLDVDESYRGILIELGELRYRMASGSFGILMDHGRATHQEVEKLYAIVANFESTHGPEKLAPAFRKMLTWPERTIETASYITWRKREQDNTGKSLKKAAAPLLNAKVGQLASLPPKIQHSLLEIKVNIDILNEEIDMQRFFFEKTFTATGSNYHVAIKSSAQCELNVADRMRIVVEKISALPLMGVPGIEIPKPSQTPPSEAEKASTIAEE